MGMTITEQILAAHAGKEYVEPGELIFANVDLVLGNDITAPVAIREFRKIGAKQVFDRERIALVPDHLPRTRILSRRNKSGKCGNLPGSLGSSISSKSGRWV